MTNDEELYEAELRSLQKSIRALTAERDNLRKMSDKIPTTKQQIITGLIASNPNYWYYDDNLEYALKRASFAADEILKI